MLDVGLNKCEKFKVMCIEKVADVHDLPFDSETFESATVSFEFEILNI